MEGTGTSLDPYQVTTVAEFRAMNGGRTTYYKLMNDLDVNDSEWAGAWTGAALNFASFDGGGYEIRNIIMAGGDYAIQCYNYQTQCTIKDIKFTNVILDSVGCFLYVTGATSVGRTDTTAVYRMSLSVVCRGVTQIFKGAGGSATFRIYLFDCALTISGRLQAIGAQMAQLNLNRVLIELDDTVFYGTSRAHILGDYSNGSVVKVAILGTASFEAAKTSWFNSNIATTVRNCYIAVEVTSEIKPSTFSGTTAYTSFYDVDLYGAPMAVAQANVYALTTAQCKDKNYLNSIGFWVV